ncbi:MAG: hypothetical protein WAK19_01215, partial [Candidatus Cybelea sp.]
RLPDRIVRYRGDAPLLSRVLYVTALGRVRFGAAPNLSTCISLVTPNERAKVLALLSAEC